MAISQAEIKDPSERSLTLFSQASCDCVSTSAVLGFARPILLSCSDGTTTSPAKGVTTCDVRGRDECEGKGCFAPKFMPGLSSFFAFAS